jgi:hypothetical protein
MLFRSLRNSLIAPAPGEVTMPSLSVKETVLRKAGVAIPRYPERRWPLQERYRVPGAGVPQRELDADAQLEAAVTVWTRNVEDLYTALTAARTAARDNPRKG